MKKYRLIFFGLLVIAVDIIITQQVDYEFIFIITLICFIYNNLYSKNNIKKSYRQLEILIPIINKLNIMRPLPKTNALNDYAASPDFLYEIIHIIEKYKPKVIIEAGSGVSTLIASYSLKKYNPGGQIISFDHDKLYADITSKEIEKHDLQKYSKIVYSKLIEYSEHGFQWYNIEEINDINNIDLIIIDGPPSKLDKYARYPAIPLLLSKMSKNAIIILDDAARILEQKVIAKWKKDFDNFIYEYIDNDKGICIIKRIH